MFKLPFNLKGSNSTKRAYTQINKTDQPQEGTIKKCSEKMTQQKIQYSQAHEPQYMNIGVQYHDLSDLNKLAFISLLYCTLH